MPRGGYRPNAGRKKTDRPSVPKSENVINRAKRDFERMTPETIEALKTLALGTSFEGKDGKVYKERPSLAAIELILAYGIGKPVDKQEITGKNGSALIPAQIDAKSIEERLGSLLALAKGRQDSKGTDSQLSEQVPLPTTPPPNEKIGVGHPQQNLNLENESQQNLNFESHPQQNLKYENKLEQRFSSIELDSEQHEQKVQILDLDAGVR